MADGNSSATNDSQAIDGLKTLDLVGLAIPIGDTDTIVSEVLGELADVIELARVIASCCPQELVDDKDTRSALCSTLYRARERAETASSIANRQALNAHGGLIPLRLRDRRVRPLDQGLAL